MAVVLSGLAILLYTLQIGEVILKIVASCRQLLHSK